MFEEIGTSRAIFNIKYREGLPDLGPSIHYRPPTLSHQVLHILLALMFYSRADNKFYQHHVITQPLHYSRHFRLKNSVILLSQDHRGPCGAKVWMQPCHATDLRAENSLQPVLFNTMYRLMQFTVYFGQLKQCWLLAQLVHEHTFSELRFFPVSFESPGPDLVAEESMKWLHSKNSLVAKHIAPTPTSDHLLHKFRAYSCEQDLNIRDA